MFVNYHILKLGETLPPLPEQILYQYVFMKGGVSIRARRREISVLLPINRFDFQFPHTPLGSAAHFVRMRKMPAWILMESLQHSLKAMPNEWLGRVVMEGDREYRLVVPRELASATPVRPIDPYADGGRAFADIHSHQRMDPFFSRIEDGDQKGFRIGAILGSLPIQPSIRVRIGVFGHFCHVPYTAVFSKVEGLRDLFYEGDENHRSSPSTDALEEGELP